LAGSPYSYYLNSLPDLVADRPEPAPSSGRRGNSFPPAPSRGPPLGLDGPGVPGPPGGNRGAPPRGVDVKPHPRPGPGPLPGSRSWSRSPRTLSRALPGPPGRGSPSPGGPAGVVLHQPLAGTGSRGGPQGPKTPKIPIFRDFGQKVPFLAFFGKNAHFGHFPAFSRPPAKGVLHQPLAAGPRGPRRGPEGPPGPRVRRLLPGSPGAPTPAPYRG